MMRIGIDYTSAVRQGAGIGRYTRELVRALMRQDVQNQYTFLAACGGVPDPGAALQDISPHTNARTLRLPLSDRALNVLWHRLRVPMAVEWLTGALDIYHSPDFSLPPVRRAHTILTVHDLSFMRVPECSDPHLRAYLLQVVPASVRRADVVLADSESTRRDVMELLQVPAARVQVVYAGVEERFQRIRDARALEMVRQRYQLPPRFVLAVGTLQPRKNYERLIEAYARLERAIRSQVKLVIVGGEGWMYEGIYHRVHELKLQDTVLFPGFVADEHLPALYSLAELLAFPSLYEGFGLPPLEAMACGTPVVCSNASSLPEVVGSAALAFNPLDVNALTEALARGLGDPSLRAVLAQRGLIQARYFTWSQAAARLLEVYEATACLPTRD